MTKNIDKIKKHRTLSFEFFPPRTDEAVEELFKVAHHLEQYHPDYVSCTYGAGGNTRGRTVEIIKRLKKTSTMEPMSHLTVSSQTQEEIHGVLKELSDAGIQNILALRGDPPKGETVFKPTEGGFLYSYNLIDHIKKNFPQMGIAAACFPEGHPEAPTLDSDIKYAKLKQDTGADFLITQLFLDNNDFYNWMTKARKVGVTIPVIPGIILIQSTQQIRRFAATCGAKIPAALNEKLETLLSDENAAREFGIEFAVKQVEELKKHSEVAGFHFYVLNRTYSIDKVLAQTGLAAGRK